MSKVARLLLTLLFAAALAACGDDSDDAGETGDGGDDATESDAGDGATESDAGDDATESDAGDGATESDAADGDVDAADDSGGGAASGPGGGILTLDGEEFTLDRFRCFFEEQPRAGLGGVFTHTAQGDFTMADGEPGIVDMSRARAEDGTVTDDISIGIGDFTAEDFVSLEGGGPEGTLEFGDASVSASGIEVSNISDFEAGPVELSFDLSCG